jgi:uncharacterized protein (TIGR02996 family)
VATEDAFLAAIRDEPADDTHRLVYADWLQDHDDSDRIDRGEFIRLQCRLAKLGEFDPERDDLEVREHELLALYERTWLGDLPAEVSHWCFRRGFLDEATLPASMFLREWERLFALYPLTGIQFAPETAPSPLTDDEEPCFPANELADCPGLDRLTSLKMRGCGLEEMDEGVEKLLGSSRLRSLRQLDLADNGLCYVGGGELIRNTALGGLEDLDFSSGLLDEPDSENVLSYFTDSKVLSSLIRLRMAEARNEPELVLGLNDAPFRERLEVLDLWGSTSYQYDEIVGGLRLPRLRALSLSGETVENGGARALLDSPHLPALSTLDLSHDDSRWRTRPEADALLRSLLTSSGWSRLESLALRRAEVTPAGLRDLARVPTNLRLLDLCGNPLEPEGIRVLAELPALAALSSLVLSGTGADDDSVAALVGSGALTNLRVLSLAGNRSLTARTVEILARSAYLPRLARLDLGETDLSGAEPESLGNLPRLTSLNLWQTSIGPDFIRRLANCSWLRRITSLNLRGNDLAGKLQALAESPYLSPLCCLNIARIALDPDTRTALHQRLGHRLVL